MSVLTILRDDAVALCIALGFKTAGSWNKQRMAKKMADLAEMVEDGSIEVEDDVDDAERLNELLLQIGESKGDVNVVQELPPEEADEPEDDAEETEDEDVDEPGDDVDDAAEVTDDTEEESVPVKPKKARKQSKKQREADREAASEGNPKPKGGKKSDGKPGVIASIIEFYAAGSEDKPVTKEVVLEKLAKRFPDREKEAMAKTVQVQTPTRIRKEKGVEVSENENGRWIAG